MLNRIASVIGWIGTVLVFGSVAVRLFRPEWNQYAYYGAWAGLACVLLYMASQWRDVAASFSRRQTRLGAIAGTTVIVVLALLIAVNYLASRRNKRWDLTANKQFSLSDQTRQILQKLDAPIKVRVFDQPAQFDRFRDRLNEYAYVSKQVSVDYIDLDKQNVEATKSQVQAYGTVVFDYKGRTERVVSSDEQQLTNGLIKVITGQQRKVYFVQGHGEKDTTSSERTGYSTHPDRLAVGQLRHRYARAGAEGRRAGRCLGGRDCRADGGSAAIRKSRPSRNTSRRAASSSRWSIRRRRSPTRRCRTSRRSCTSGPWTWAPTSSSTSAASGS